MLLLFPHEHTVQIHTNKNVVFAEDKNRLNVYIAEGKILRIMYFQWTEEELSGKELVFPRLVRAEFMVVGKYVKKKTMKVDVEQRKIGDLNFDHAITDMKNNLS